MNGDRIPDKDHIARYCRSTQAPDGQIQATAFMLREDEEYLSVNWLEFLGCPNRSNEIAELQNIYAVNLRVGKHAKIAILNVGEARERILTESQDRRSIEVLHAPTVTDPSHSGIYNLNPDMELIAELILKTVRATFPARS